LAELSVEIDEAQLHMFITWLEGRSESFKEELLDQGLEAGLKLAEELTPYGQTGALVQSIMGTRDRDGFTIDWGADHAKYVEYGTKPHQIVPRTARALRFDIDGETIFARRVQHPGFPGRHFRRQVLEALEPELQELARVLMGARRWD